MEFYKNIPYQTDNHLSNKQVIDLISSGDPKGYEHLIVKFGGALKHYGHVQFRDVDLDIIYNAVIDTFNKVINSLNDYQYKGEDSFNYWLFKIYYNTVISKLREQKAEKRGGKINQVAYHELAFELYDTESDNIEINLEKRNQISLLFKNLSHNYSIILWYVAQGYSDKEIAKIFCKSQSSIRSLRRRAIIKAREILSNAE